MDTNSKGKRQAGGVLDVVVEANVENQLDQEKIQRGSLINE